MIARLRQLHPVALMTMLVVIGVLFWMLSVLAARGPAGGVFWIAAALLWMLAWIANDALAHSEAATKSLGRLRDFFVPAVFGITLLFLWQVIVKGFGIPAVLLPAPSDIWAKLV
ncbi:MAG: ABC transporter permease, partial [Rhizobiales bacterium]|nr:ABC transporter permease [Hyphomicrobiales bacterium]